MFAPPKLYVVLLVGFNLGLSLSFVFDRQQLSSSLLMGKVRSAYIGLLGSVSVIA